MERKHKKKTKEDREALVKIINSFFESSMSCLKTGGKRKDIMAIYKDHIRKWAYYSYKTSEGKKEEAQFVIQYFVSAIDKAHKAVASKAMSPASALSMLRVLRYVQGKSKLKCFFREFPFWVWHVYENIKSLGNNKKSPPKMTATVTERAAA